MSSSTSGFDFVDREILPPLGGLAVNMQEIFQDTWDHFVVKNNPPGYDEEMGGCSYLEGCAIGRLMDVEWCEEAESDGPVQELGPDLINRFLQKHPGVSTGFLRCLQDWHDNVYQPYYYGHKKNTSVLTEVYQKIAEEFGLDDSFINSQCDPTESALGET
jgi:hypothetical protein